MDDIQTSFSYKVELLDSRTYYTTTTNGRMASNYNGEYLFYYIYIYIYIYLNVNICFYILSLSTDVFENIEFDDDL